MHIVLVTVDHMDNDYAGNWSYTMILWNVNLRKNQPMCLMKKGFEIQFHYLPNKFGVFLKWLMLSCFKSNKLCEAELNPNALSLLKGVGIGRRLMKWNTGHTEAKNGVWQLPVPWSMTRLSSCVMNLREIQTAKTRNRFFETFKELT